jgi:hypothetical protein
MTPHERQAEIYRKLHANRYEHVEQARRAREADCDRRIAIETLELLLYGTVEHLEAFKEGYFNAQSDT